jgi:hypothetical protein
MSWEEWPEWSVQVCLIMLLSAVIVASKHFLAMKITVRGKIGSVPIFSNHN